ncbi:hypothetical protein PO909_023470, partial [Leuciscus waleckii]
RRLWVHNIIRGRKLYGAYNNLVQELRLDDARFVAYFRLHKSQFEDLLQIIAPSIAKTQTKFRETISAEERFCICLRYLATGDSFRSIAFGFRVGASTLAGIVSQVCEAIWNCLLSDCMPVPDAAEWYRFRLVDIGAYGRNSDGGTLAASAFGSALRQSSLRIPEDSPLPGAEHLGAMPYVFLADEAFPLCRNILRPYPGHNTGERKVFHFRLSHARRMVECTFGILAAQWRVYRRYWECLRRWLRRL